jgi:two-component system chemotaxis sensor kinase CheA
VVDELLGQQQVVIKSLGEKLMNIPGISGASILGDGRVGLILDASTLIELSIKQGAS